MCLEKRERVERESEIEKEREKEKPTDKAAVRDNRDRETIERQTDKVRDCNVCGQLVILRSGSGRLLTLFNWSRRRRMLVPTSNLWPRGWPTMLRDSKPLLVPLARLVPPGALCNILYIYMYSCTCTHNFSLIVIIFVEDRHSVAFVCSLPVMWINYVVKCNCLKGSFNCG